MTSPYTILSIGPILQTFQLADNTRAVWTVSFMFSYLMKETIQNLTKYKDDFLVPHFNDDFSKYMDNPKSRIGMFHDRLIIKGDKSKEIKVAYKCAVRSLARLVYELFMRTTEEKFTYVQLEVDKPKVKEFIQGYFQSYIACVDVSEERNPILELSRYVDGVENEPRLAPYEEEEFLYLLFRLTNLSAFQSFAFDEESEEQIQERCFKSLPEISAWEFIKEGSEKWKKEYLCLSIDKLTKINTKIKDPSSQEDEILKKVKSDNKDHFKPYHKYIAVVYADGDGFGKYLEKMKNDEHGTIEEKVKTFSDNIFAFISDARDLIGKQGGYPVIGSGEDLLFFAPVVNGNKNIFTHIHQIDKVFKKHFDDPNLSMSYGVSISYYKFPLQETLAIAQDALWENAKKATWTNRVCFATNPNATNRKEKNAIHVNIQKHSGQSHAMTLAKDSCLYSHFYKLLLQELSHKNTLHLPHALHHSLARVDTIIDTMPVENIEHFFVNMFNENVHKSRHKEALNSLQEILKLLKNPTNQESIYRIYTDENNIKSIQKPSEVIFGMLSIIKMLRGDA